MSTYKEALTASMLDLASDRRTRFVGYGVKIGGRAHGTLKAVPDEQLVETPVAENLMVGLAIGMSLSGLLPVVFIERFDFILNALDAIVNHLDKIAKMSRGQFKPAIILRVVVGNRSKPFFTGATHIQDFSPAMRQLVTFPVVNLIDGPQVKFEYSNAKARLCAGWSTMLIEYKDLII